MTTRRSFVIGGIGSVAAAAIGTRARAASSLQKINVVIPQNSAFVLGYSGGKDAGIFKKHGIDLEVDARPFAGFLAGLPSKQCMAVTYSGIDAITKMNEGLDLVVIGGGLTTLQDIFVRADSPIKNLADLKGKRLGVWSTGAGAYKVIRTSVLDSAGYDIAKDTKQQQVAAPALFKLLERGQVDAMINISSFTIKAHSEPNKFRSIFSPNDFWEKKTGYPNVWTAPLVAWRSWVKQDPTRAKNFSEAVMESFAWLRDPKNLETAVKAHGRLAGISDAATVATYRKLLGEKKVFLTEWNQKVADSQWEFLELCKKYDILNKVPDEKTHGLVL